jgi:D-alanyl-D-alanine endopeptidase (penicillin-binding protein 7)
MNKKYYTISAIVLLFCTSVVRAEETEIENKYYKLNIDHATLAKGYTVSAFDLKLSLVPGILSSSTDVEIIELHEPIDEPWSLNRVSEFYQFEFKNKTAYDNHKPYYIQFAYQEEDGNYKQVYFYDKNFSTWRPLPTKDFPEEKFVRSLIHLPFARIAVFSYPNVMSTGSASWYSYKPGAYAASPDFPKGSVLRVSAVNSDKFIDVEINDYGPDRSLFPNRVIDLEKNAFAALAPLGAGTIDVKIEPLIIRPDHYGKILGVNEEGVGASPVINAKSGILFDEKSGRVIWEKNSHQVLPLASLTKLVSAKVFLDQRPSFNNVVTYSEKDAEKTYQWANKWEIAKLALEEGDQLTVEDLFYAALVGSANNTVETLVRASGLSRDDFIAKMNSFVKEWGATSSFFVEPTGLAPENVSSAADYVIISKEVLKNPIIQKVSVMDEYKFELKNRDKQFRVRNTNKIINQDKYTVTGSKTGYLHEAGYCLMLRITYGAQSLIVVTFNADTRDQSFDETTRLLEYGLDR